MKKLLMAVTILATGAVAYAAAPSVSTPVSVSLDVVTTSNVVLMDGAVQLTQIDLAHPQIMLTAAQVHHQLWLKHLQLKQETIQKWNLRERQELLFLMT